jgi:hypothetical protein
MQQSAGSVPVIARFQSERLHDGLQTAHVLRQLRRANSSVFNERDRLRWPDATGQKRETRFAHRPDKIHLRWIGQDFRAQPELSRLQDRQSVRHPVVEFNDQDRFAWLRIEFEQIARRLKMELAFGLIEQRPINVFDRGRLKIEKSDRCLHRFSHGREKDQAQSLLARQRRNLEFSGENRGEGPFAPRENIREIIRRVEKSFDAVTGPALD